MLSFAVPEICQTYSRVFFQMAYFQMKFVLPFKTNQNLEKENMAHIPVYSMVIESTLINNHVGKVYCSLSTVIRSHSQT